MISDTVLFILGGCLLGAIQLVCGIALGMWLRRPGRAERGAGRELARAGEFARRLQSLAGELSSSAHEHRSQLAEATQLLTSDELRSGESLAELVVGVLGGIVHANQQLQSKLETAENRLEAQAAEIEAHISRSLTDPLTGLPNRREFNDRLEERMAAWNRRQEPFSLLLVDVDHFKKLNDKHGHLAGDQVLAALGRALRGAVRREDIVARYGGEEFAILLPNTTLTEAINVAQKVRETVSATAVCHNAEQFSVTVSGGLAMIVANERYESLIQRADAALYAAKSAGRNCTFVHDGTDCRSTEEFMAAGGATSFAAELVTLINSPEPQRLPEADDDNDIKCGAYLDHERMSTELAQTCDELRRLVEEREPRAAAPTTAR
jgi:diguanylate cyclase